MNPWASLSAVAATALAAGAPGPYECNFLSDPSIGCMLPFPDNFFLSTTWNSSAAPALTFTPASFPADASGNTINPAEGGYNGLQGFSPMGPAMAYFSGLSLEGSALPRLWDIPSSVAGVSTAANSVLIDVSTGTPVMHWVELDHSSDTAAGGVFGKHADDVVSAGDDTQRMLLMWPASRLRDNATYIIAFRRLVDDSGAPIAPSAGFAALRDKVATNNPALEASRPRFEALFSTIASVTGWARGDLTLAWDFTTNTKGNITSAFISMRDDAFSRIAADGGVRYTITQVNANSSNANISRVITGQFYVPTYLPDDAIPSLHSRLIVDGQGRPVFQKLVPFDFEVIIPTSVAAAGAFRAAATKPRVSLVQSLH